MGVTIHQALYGDKNDGYALLKTSLVDEKLANRICNSTDLSDRGSNWTPAIRGFSFEDLYLVIKTYPDNSLGVRAGRVFSHVLIIQKVDILKVNNLIQLFRIFQSEMDKSIDIAPIDYLDEDMAVEVNRARLLKAARGLLNEQTVVWIGQSQFSEAIAAIWKNQWDGARFDFHFGINFNPSAISTKGSSFICTPESLRSKWQTTSLCIVDIEDTLESARPAELYLINTEAETEFTRFLDQLGTRPKSLKQLTMLERGLETFSNLETITDFNEVYSLYSIIQTYNATVGARSDLLKNVLKRIIHIVPSVGAQSINALRKLKITKGTEVLKSELESAIKNWLASNLFDQKFNEVEDTSRILVNSTSNESEDWWRNLVANSIHDHFVNWSSFHAPIFLRWLIKDGVGVLGATSGYFQLSTKIERDLADVISIGLKNDVSNQLLIICRKQGWMQLHAKVLVMLNKKNVLGEQVKIDVNPLHLEGILLIATHIENNEFIRQTLSLDDDRLFKVAGEMVALNADLLSNFNIAHPGWQKILVGALVAGKTLELLFDDPYNNVVYPFLDIVEKNEQHHEELFRLISQSEYADIHNYPKRQVIWAFIPGSILKVFLSKTIEGLSMESNFLDQSLEKPLSDVAHTDGFVSNFIQKHGSHMNEIVSFFLKYPAIQEKHLIAYLRDLNNNFNGLDAQKLGKLVYDRRWTSSLDIIQSKARTNQSFKTAFQECVGLLSVFAYYSAAWQGLIAKIEISSNDWWKSLELLACRLYPEGPVDQRIWHRAGGNESDLQHKATGQEMWQRALHRLSNGGAGKLTTDRLLSEMKRDFSTNGDLNSLIEIKKKI